MHFLSAFLFFKVLSLTSYDLISIINIIIFNLGVEMENNFFLAIDIGASSGRHILGYIDNGKLCLEEIYRFKNGAENKNGKTVWNHDSLFDSILEGLKKCKELNKIPCSIGIDTWGVDYALLDENDQLIDEIYAYRDERTQKVIDEVHSIISEKDAYSISGIQKEVFNSIYQLYCDKVSGKMQRAKTMLLMPDYLNFLLTGVKKCEFTEASTTALLNAKTRQWDFDLIEKLGLKKEIFLPISMPGSLVGELKQEIVSKIGFTAKVYLPATHDTASAVCAVPESDFPLFISSGTWSLMGVASPIAFNSEDVRLSGFSNEGGYGDKTLCLSNIMGMWMIQCVKKEYNDKYSFVDFVREAKSVKDFNSIVDVKDLSFYAPESMIEAVKNYCKKTSQQVPETVGEIVLCIYQSLAECYKNSVQKIESFTGKKFDSIYIVGGGCQNELMNELTAKFTGKKVVAGPVEATAIGNILAQMLASNTLKSAEDGVELIKKSFEIKEIIA